MKNLIKKILKESTESNYITIAGVNLSISGYISPQPKGRSDVFLIVENKEKGIDYGKYLEIQTIFKNVGIKSSPSKSIEFPRKVISPVMADGNVVTRVHEIRLSNLELSNILKIYLETVLNTNTDSFFE